MKIDFDSLLREGKSVLLADGGSTKMEWLLAKKGRIVWRHTEPGLNPLVSGFDAMADTFDRVARQLPESPKAVGYYGAGCIESVCGALSELLTLSFGCPAECGSDLLLAARMLCPTGKGLICILGTGSNSGLFRDGAMVNHTPSLGYALGDEGGAAYMGRCIVAGCLRRQADEAAMRQWKSLGISEQDTLAQVYGPERKPGAWLGDILRRMEPAYADSPWLQSMIEQSMRDFFSNIIMCYGLENDVPVYFAGTPAARFAEILHRLGREYGVSVADIVARPFDKLNPQDK